MKRMNREQLAKSTKGGDSKKKVTKIRGTGAATQGTKARGPMA